MTPRVVSYHTGTMYVVALVVRDGYKHAHIVYIDDHGIVARKIPIEEAEELRELEYKPKKARRKLLEIGKRKGITIAAKELLDSMA